MDRTSSQPAPEMRDLTLDLCACARSAGADAVRAALLACPGIEQAHVDTYVTWALATFDPTRATPDSIVEHMAAAGYDVRLTQLFDADELVSKGAPLPCPPLPSDPVEELP